MASTSDSAPKPGLLARRSADLVTWMLARKSRSAVVLITTLLLGIVAAWYGGSIEVDTDLRRLLPKSAPSVAALDLLEQRKGSAEGFVVAIDAPTPEDANAMVIGLAEEIASWPETTSVVTERDYTPLRAHALYMLDLEQLEELRDELKAERKQAVARAMGPGLVEGEVDPDQLSGEDWDDPDAEALDWGSPPAEPPSQPAEPSAQPPSEPAKSEGADIQRFLTEERQRLIDRGILDPEEVALIWPEENEQGQIPWAEHIGRPFEAEGGKVRTIHASLSTPATDVEFAQDAVARVERRAAALREEAGLSADTRVQVVAAYNVSRAVNTIVRDAGRATWISATSIILVLLIGFRGLRILPLVLVPMFVAMTSTLAIAKLTYGNLNALTVFLFAVLFGMGVDFSVHLFALREHQGKQADWPAVIRDHFRPLAAAMLTTSGSLFVLALAEFKAFREFGVIAAIGVFLAFAASTLLVPVTDSLIGPLRRVPKSVEARQSDEKRATLSPGVARLFSGLRYAALLVIAGVSLVGAPKLSMEKDTRVLNSTGEENTAAKKEIKYGSTGGRYKSLALVADSPEELDLVVDRLLELEASGEVLPGAIDTGEVRRPWVKDVYSLTTVMPTDQERKAKVIAEIGVQVNDLLAELPDLDEEARRYQTHLEALERLSKVDPLTVEELPDWSLEPFREKDGHVDRIAHVYLDIAGYSIDELVAVRHRLDELLADTNVHAADSRLVFADLMVLVEHDAERIPLYAMLVIFLFIGLDLRVVVGTIACFMSLVLGASLSIAVMGLWPLHLNFFNLVVMPAVIGLGIDTSIHLWHGRDKQSLAATGKAALLSALTTVAGFSGLLAAHHAGLRSIGEVGVMAIATCVGVAFLALYPLRR
jgi:predicted RND superfamily exporter protein